jgi:hypothetical protein
MGVRRLGVRRRITLPLLIIAACWPRMLLAQSGHQHGGMTMTLPPVKDCPTAALSCAVSATPFFTKDGTLYLAWSAGDRIVMARSTDKGAHFGPPVMVDPAKEVIDAGPDSRPSIVVDDTGRITVAYAIFRNRQWDGEVRVAHADAGQPFSVPVPVADNPASQRFQTLLLAPDGSIFAAWLDKRARLTMSNPKDFEGAGLAWTWIPPHGQPTGAARLGQDNTCECCRLGVALAAPDRPVALFRNIFPGSVRDHAIVAFRGKNEPGPTHRVSDDDWVISACPHHGPALAVDDKGGWHAAWFTLGRNRQGVFYAHSFDQGAHFSAPLRIGAPDDQAGRPSLLALGDMLYLAWKQFDGDHSVIRLMVSSDRGEHFAAPVTVASTGDASDHPILIADGNKPYLSWLTDKEGYRLIALEASE